MFLKICGWSNTANTRKCISHVAVFTNVRLIEYTGLLIISCLITLIDYIYDQVVLRDDNVYLFLIERSEWVRINADLPVKQGSFF